MTPHKLLLLLIEEPLISEVNIPVFLCPWIFFALLEIIFEVTEKWHHLKKLLTWKLRGEK